MSEQQRKYESSSSTQLYRKCPMAYWFRYVDGKKIPPSGAMFKGTCFHEYTEHEYRHKAGTGNDIPLDEATDKFAEVFDEGKDAVDWKEDKPDDVKDKGVKIVEAYHSEIAPSVIPKSPENIERKAFIEFEEDIPDILAYVDLVDISDVIVDTKTTGKKPGEDDTRGSSQLTQYSAMMQVEDPGAFPEDQPVKVRHDFVYQTRAGNIQLIQQESVRTKAQIDQFLADYQAVALQIQFSRENAVWPMAPDAAWWCGPKQCGYWSMCKGKSCGSPVTITSTQYKPPKEEGEEA